jgi:cardiolipin synthase (CMP-forming)
MRLAVIPNIITVVRILLVLPTAWLLWQERYVEALVLMTIAGASDAVDGWLARRWNAVSRFGAAVDPVADKLLVAAMFVVFTIQAHLPLWLVLIVIGRDLCIVAGATAYRLLFGRIEFAPTLVSKANTAAQITVLLLVLVELCRFGWLSELVGRLLDPWSFYLLALLAITSGADYVITWSLRAIRQSRSGRAS